MLVTRRRDQIEVRRGGKRTACPNQIIGGVIFCGSQEGRENWIRLLSQRHPSRFNHFVCFRDVQSAYALQFSFAEWAYENGPDYVYVCR